MTIKSNKTSDETTGPKKNLKKFSLISMQIVNRTHKCF